MPLGLLAAILIAQVPEVLTLDGALESASARNLDLLSARARLTQADEISNKVWAQYLPQLSVAGNYTYNSVEAKIGLPTGYFVRDVVQPQGPEFDPSRDPGVDNPPGRQTSLVLVPSGFAEAVIQRKHQLGAQAQLSQALIVPALWPAIRNAYLAERSAELSVENARREILFAVTQVYYGAEGLREAVDVQKRLLAVNVQHQNDAELRFKVGALPKVALLRAQIERARAEQDLLRTQNAYASMKLSLATLLDRDADFEVTRPTTPSLPGDEGSLIQHAVLQRPDVKAAQTNLELAEGGRTGIWFKYAPSLVALARYQVSNARGFTGQYDQWTVGAALNWTLWDGGLREAELREAAARVVEARAGERALQNKVREEVRRALLDLQSAQANRTKAEEQLKLAVESSVLVKTSFDAGAATYLEVVDANAARTGAELNVISEQLNAQLAALKVAKAAGLFNPLPSSPAEIPSPR